MEKPSSKFLDEEQEAPSDVDARSEGTEEPQVNGMASSDDPTSDNPLEHDTTPDLQDDEGSPEPEKPQLPPEEPKEEVLEDDFEEEPPSTADLENRVRRLEDALATLQKNTAAPARSAITNIPGKPLPTVSTLKPFKGPGDASAGVSSLSGSHKWLFFEMYCELRAILRMYLDPRYRISWQTKLFPPLFLLGMVLTWWIIGSIPFVGFVLERVINLVLAYMLVKVLIREATRYRQLSPDIPPSMRL